MAAFVEEGPETAAKRRGTVDRRRVNPQHARTHTHRLSQHVIQRERRPTNKCTTHRNLSTGRRDGLIATPRTASGVEASRRGPRSGKVSVRRASWFLRGRRARRQTCPRRSGRGGTTLGRQQRNGRTSGSTETPRRGMRFAPGQKNTVGRSRETLPTSCDDAITALVAASNGNPGGRWSQVSRRPRRSSRTPTITGVDRAELEPRNTEKSTALRLTMSGVRVLGRATRCLRCLDRPRVTPRPLPLGGFLQHQLRSARGEQSQREKPRGTPGRGKGRSETCGVI